ncbi:hypothetical protein HELRODRAFT_172015 [Helobdella robusta]|uniref:Uncharacterized protein n=1 Tax=Helobdella robusta TaxID=6412 RepID=T1F4Y0_HELRO|nr:hypothetical protein HELRODRAFT_172015 [Helobdella robusta]ESO05003.1 hypothetical protein HELRODRAFT_172015 [Helobdella robusta]
MDTNWLKLIQQMEAIKANVDQWHKTMENTLRLGSLNPLNYKHALLKNVPAPTPFLTHQSTPTTSTPNLQHVGRTTTFPRNSPTTHQHASYHTLLPSNHGMTRRMPLLPDPPTTNPIIQLHHPGTHFKYSTTESDNSITKEVTNNQDANNNNQNNYNENILQTGNKNNNNKFIIVRPYNRQLNSFYEEIITTLILHGCIQNHNDILQAYTINKPLHRILFRH